MGFSQSASTKKGIRKIFNLLQLWSIGAPKGSRKGSRGNGEGSEQMLAKPGETNKKDF
jgi:hypothetical protein